MQSSNPDDLMILATLATLATLITLLNPPVVDIVGLNFILTLENCFLSSINTPFDDLYVPML